jgi:hypothetical protein
MRPLFRAFETHRVRYLIIGGQASILYGGAHFSQDLDLWVEPSEGNVRRFLDALEGLGARFHMLTPPISIGRREGWGARRSGSRRSGDAIGSFGSTNCGGFEPRAGSSPKGPG